MTFTPQVINSLPSRKWADKSHTYLGSSETGPDMPSPDAIGGAYGISWYEVYQDEKGEIYCVHCYDGTYRSKGAFKEEIQEGYEFTWKEPSEFTLGEVMNSREK